MRIPLTTVLLAILVTPTAANAQGYVAASINADVVRNGTVDDIRSPGTGEAVSFSLRTGTTLTSRFGVEVDFTRGSEIETDESPDPRILADLPSFAFTDLLPSIGLPDFFPSLVLPDAIPTSAIIGYRIHTREQATAITAAATMRQEVSPRFSLMYLGGVAFARMERSVSTSFDYLPIVAPLIRPTYESRAVSYDTGPMAGIEGRIALTEHAHLIPGFRLLGIGNGWVMRPAVGLGWTF